MASGEAEEEAAASRSWVLGWRSLVSAGQPSLSFPDSGGGCQYSRVKYRDAGKESQCWKGLDKESVLTPVESLDS